MAGHIATASREDWTTPEEIVTAVRETFTGPIDLDPCSNAESIVGARVEFMLPAKNGLTADWAPAKTVYVNPPFGEGLARWVGRCVHARRDLGAEVVLLLPAAVDVQWWQDRIFPTAEAICFHRSRIQFRGAPSVDAKSWSAPMACALVYWGAHPERFARSFRAFGVVLVRAGDGRWSTGEEGGLLLKRN